MKVSIGVDPSRSYLILSHGPRNTRVVALNNCLKSQLTTEYTNRIFSNLRDWYNQYFLMMKEKSVLIPNSDLNNVLEVNSSRVFISGIPIEIFTRLEAQKIMLNLLSQRSSNRNNSRRPVRQAPDMTNLDAVVSSIQSNRLDGFTRSMSLDTSVKSEEKVNPNIGGSRWDLDFNDKQEIVDRSIESSSRWDLDWD